jgi:hypothetical protein
MVRAGEDRRAAALTARHSGQALMWSNFSGFAPAYLFVGQSLPPTMVFR